MIKRVVLILLILFVLYGTQKVTVENVKVQPASQIEVSREAITTVAVPARGGLAESEMATVAHVIDGDTIELEGGRRVRFIGIDAPETGKKDKKDAQDVKDKQNQGECFAKEAAEETGRLVMGKTVRMEKDVSETDKYGRLLRYIYVDDVFINDHLVRQGFAWVMGIPPDTKYYGQLKEAEQEAREQKRGLWSMCY